MNWFAWWNVFLADLISNCFFEVSDVNILYFLGFQSFTGVVEPPTECLFFCLLITVTILFSFAMELLLLGEFNDG